MFSAQKSARAGHGRLSLCLLIALFLVAGAPAQEITLQSSSTVVLVPTLVTDASGQSIHGLRSGDFVVLDNGIPQDVRVDELYELQPVSVVVALDCSSTAAHALEMARRLGTMLDPLVADGRGELALVGFDSQSKLLVDFTSSTAALSSALKDLRASAGGPAILDAVQYATRLLATRPTMRRKVLLIISATKDEGSALTVEEVVRKIEASNILVYSVTYSAAELGSRLTEPNPAQSGVNLLNVFHALTRAARENAPKAVAEMTGGEYFEFGSKQELEDRLDRIGNHFFNTYLLSFQPKNPKPGQHMLTVRLREPAAVIIRSRTGYWAAAQTPATGSKTD
jgi:VWFA-related protein